MAHWREWMDESPYLTWIDLKGKDRVVKIVKTEQGVVSGPQGKKKCVLITFEGVPKPFGSNVTCNETIEAVTGKEDPKDWVGATITLYVTTTLMKDGTTRRCIRVRPK